jgi:hypothetical protein
MEKVQSGCDVIKDELEVIEVSGANKATSKANLSPSIPMIASPTMGPELKNSPL